MDYDHRKHHAFVKEELERLGLHFLLNWCDAMETEAAMSVGAIVWESRRASIQSESYKKVDHCRRTTHYTTKETNLQLPG